MNPDFTIHQGDGERRRQFRGFTHFILNDPGLVINPLMDHDDMVALWQDMLGLLMTPDGQHSQHGSARRILENAEPSPEPFSFLVPSIQFRRLHELLRQGGYTVNAPRNLEHVLGLVVNVIVTQQGPFLIHRVTAYLHTSSVGRDIREFQQ